MLNDTITALATSPGYGGIAMVRLSGENTLPILKEVFAPPKPPCPFQSKKMYYGHIQDEGEVVDEVMVTFMKGPSTYTREDVGEIYCHGGIISANLILSLLLKKGARMAERGEFTKRAFLNGRLDLAKAQSVLDIINAKTPLSQKLAQKQLSGKLSNKVSQLREEINLLLAEISANIDFPDEIEEEITNQKTVNKIDQIVKELGVLIESYEDGKIIKDGLNVAIVGSPNAGKSSLLNELLQEERAIVTDIEGTTRDTIKESIILGGSLINLIDTAGIREGKDEVERLGIDRSLKSIEEADLVLLVIDGSNKLDPRDREIIKRLKGKETIALINKSDLSSKVTKEDLEGDFITVLSLSIKKGQGIDDLKNFIEQFSYKNPSIIEDSVIITSLEQKNLLLRAKSSLMDCKYALEGGFEQDVAQIDLYDSLDFLGQITGVDTEKSVLDSMFENFCIGK